MFGTMGIYGDEPNLHVRGLWMWRGTDECPEEMKQHTSFEFYIKRRLDTTKPEDKALVMEYWNKLDEEEDKVENETVRFV